MNDPADANSPAADDQRTGFPALRTWRAVYLTVVAIFVTWVVLLTALSRAFR
jgi:hypothetical protein